MARLRISGSRSGGANIKGIVDQEKIDRLFSGETFTISNRDLCYFSGGDKDSEHFPNPTIHTSLKVAQECGLKQQMASGAMFEGVLADLIYRIVGDVWYKQGRMRLKYLIGVTLNDEITPYAKKITDGYEVWCENQNKVITCVGQAILLEG